MRIGTRGSALALAQARSVAGRLDIECELVAITTAGDAGAGASDKSRWVSALEQALLAGSIDIAVHSAKDVPAELAPGLALVAIPPRIDPRDAICGAPTVMALPPGARVGTSSLRRAAQIRAVREDLRIVELRGNVDTRLRKLAEGQCDALVLAMAGLERLGRAGEADGLLDDAVPAAGQGALAVEARPGALDPDQVARITDADAFACVAVERELTRALGATCHTPVGAHARNVDGQLELRAWVGAPDGSAWIADRLRGPASGLGDSVARRMIAAGADALLRRAERAA